ncbi:hypothetical protein [Enterococcus innesii]|uniref:hypothetical protein n=1 Tax=Enterococcus innesii TaxID=2839759 RepID=UPI0034A4BAA8
MKKRQSYWKYLMLMGLLGVLVSGCQTADERENYSGEQEGIQEQLANEKEKNAKLQEELEQEKQKYEDLNRETYGPEKQALYQAIDETFSLICDYDTTKREDSVANRKKKLEQWVTSTGINDLFPNDADQGEYSVETRSYLSEEPEVYLMTDMRKVTNGKLLALVMVRFEFSVAGSDAQKGHALYKVIFDRKERKLADLDNLGDIDVY